jgi:hypothetical protein
MVRSDIDTTPRRADRRQRSTGARLAGGLAATAAVCALLGPGLGTATANTTGCTLVSDGDTCLTIGGSKLHVDFLRQLRDRLSTPLICNYQGHFTVEHEGNKFDGWSDLHAGCFISPTATRTVNVGRDFPDFSEACGEWWENGSLLGKACNQLHS